MYNSVSRCKEQFLELSQKIFPGRFETCGIKSQRFNLKRRGMVASCSAQLDTNFTIKFASRTRSAFVFTSCFITMFISHALFKPTINTTSHKNNLYKWLLNWRCTLHSLGYKIQDYYPIKKISIIIKQGTFSDLFSLKILYFYTLFSFFINAHQKYWQLFYHTTTR